MRNLIPLMLLLAGCLDIDEAAITDTSEAALFLPDEHRGFVTSRWLTDSADTTRCVANVPAQLDQMRTYGDVLGYHMGAGHPDPSCSGGLPGSCADHWQGMQRLAVGDGRTLAVSSSDDTGAYVAVVRLPSRRPDRLRLRSNRLSTVTAEPSTAVPSIDVIARSVKDTTLDPWGNLKWQHPGGVQAIGRYLFVPQFARNGTPWSGIAVYDVCPGQPAWSCDPSHGITKLYDHVVYGQAAAVAVAKLATGQHLMVVQNHSLGSLYVTATRAGSSVRDPAAWQFGSTAAIPFSNIPGWTSDYQAIQLVTDCSGELYLIASHWTGSDNWGGNDWFDLYRLHVVASGGSIAVASVERLADHYHHHAVCNLMGDNYCNLDAAGAAYVDPAGRLLLYSTEHDNDGQPGGHVKMKEWSVAGNEPCTLERASVELFGAPGGRQVLMIDFVDRFRRGLDDFAKVSFNDRATSARYCIPPGHRFLLFPDSGFRGTPRELTGTGQATIGIATSFGTFSVWSSACFADAYGCLPRRCGDGVCETGESCAADCACAHSTVWTGAPLRRDCDLCVTTVCDDDPHCCTSAWDASCVQRAEASCAQVQ